MKSALTLQQVQDERHKKWILRLLKSELGCLEKMNKKLCGYFVLAIGVFIIDRITKLAALAWCANDACVVNQFLSFEVVFNRGVSWGMFHSASDIVFVVVSVIIAIITTALGWYAYHRYAHRAPIVAEVLIVAGSISNLIDRVIYSGVVDFIILSYGTMSWPVFNIADAAIVFGVGLLVFQYDSSIHP
jgi:signal peptidase II